VGPGQNNPVRVTNPDRVISNTIINDTKTAKVTKIPIKKNITFTESYVKT